MKQLSSILALAASGAIVASAGAYAAQADPLRNGFVEAAIVGPVIGLGGIDAQRDVIEPPSSVDPGIAIDPPSVGAKTPIIRPPTDMVPGGRMILPR
jgi:hypothetical protein